MKLRTKLAVGAALAVAAIGIGAPAAAYAADAPTPSCNSGQSYKDDSGSMHYVWNNCEDRGQVVTVLVYPGSAGDYCVDPGVHEIEGAWYSSNVYWTGDYC